MKYAIEYRKQHWIHGFHWKVSQEMPQHILQTKPGQDKEKS